MPAPKPKAVQAPYQGTTSQQTSGTRANTFGYASQDPNNPYVRAYMNAPIDIDPGVGWRGDLAEQEAQHRWNSGFASGVPAHVRELFQAAQQRKIKSETAAQAQQAEYIRQQMQLARAQSLLPQLVNTGGTESGTMSGSQQGYNTQVLPGQQGLFGNILSSFAGGVGSGLSGFFGGGSRS